MQALVTQNSGQRRGPAKSIGLGSLLYRLYYQPKSRLTRLFREGPLQVALTNYGRREMERQALRLTPLGDAQTDAPLEISFLSGRRFWYQTCFCAHSLMRHARQEVRPVIYDDGTLDAEYAEKILRVLPGARIVGAREIEERLEAALPASRFPTLRLRRVRYVHLRKLTDVHAGSQGWKLVLDSDMLFLRRPALLLDWLDAPRRPVYMLDAESCYGYSETLMTELAGAPIPTRLNVGICGLRSEEVDWEKLEAWSRTLIEREGMHYYLEQALTAMLLAGRASTVAPEAEYIINPTRADVRGERGVLHHYVAESKAWYFRHAWQPLLRSA